MLLSTIERCTMYLRARCLGQSRDIRDPVGHRPIPTRPTYLPLPTYLPPNSKTHHERTYL
eukprot:scaffold4277_cov79-Skeletonema_dohrnii-CCMP3373.AAC.1